MTKSWSDIREEASRLYLSGKTLSEVKDHVEAKFDFKASTRSYRLHFQKWGVTKSHQLQEYRARSAVSSGRDRIEAAPGDRQEGFSAMLDAERTNSTTPESRFLAVPTDNLVHRSRGLQAGRSPSIDGMTFSTPSLSHFESMYRDLRSATPPARASILARTNFNQEADNILHFVATTDDRWTLNYLVYYMKEREMSIDCLSIQRRTALEIAIEVRSESGVETLLDAGASVVRRNDQEQQPLHFAIAELAPANICRLLIDHGAMVNSPFRYEDIAITPMRMTLDRYQSTNDEHEKSALCSILQVLVDNGAEIDPDDALRGESLTKFVQASIQLNSTSKLVRESQMRPSSLLGYYFSANLNPLCWFPKKYCPCQECESLAAFVFSHTPNSGLSGMLIETSDMAMYGLGLVQVLLKPCAMRYSSVYDPSINDLLQRLLQRLKDRNVSDLLEPGLLRAMLDQQVSREVTLERLRTLLESGLVSQDECRETMNFLWELEDGSFQLSLAELVLAQLVQVPNSAWTYQDFTTHFFQQTVSRIQDYADDEHARDRFRDHVLSKLQVTPPTFESRLCIAQCVVHVFTKLMLEGNMGHNTATAERIIYMASRLRQAYNLPDIPVATKLLLELRITTSQQNKHFRGVFGSDTSDTSGSPETHMSDSPASIFTPDGN